MLSLKYLTKKFNKQSLNEVKPAPLSETVDHTLSAPPTSFTGHTSVSSLTASSSPPTYFSSTPPTSTNQDTLTFFNTASMPSPSPSTSSTSSSAIVPEDTSSQSHHLVTKHSQTSSSTSASSSTSFPSPHAAVSTSSLSPSSSISSSDSEESEDEDTCRKLSPSLRVRATRRPRSPRKVRPAATQLRIERISSAEKRKYSQFKCSTGSNSSPSSSDDEVKEAFEAPATTNYRQRWSRTPPTYPNTLWAQTIPSLSSTPSTASETQQQQQQQQQLMFNNSWSTGQFEACANRPLKVTPVGHNKHKFFAQMSSRFSSERPYLDFNKMQHSKRVVTVRRPMVIRNHSKVHSIQRPPSLCPHVSLDISQSSFQPVLTQT